MTTKMKAMVFTRYGAPDGLQLVDVDKPTPKAGEVLVKVVATAVNQADHHVLSGSLRFSTGLLKPKQRILGSDIAGVVEAIGPNVTQFQVGDAVFGDLSGQGRGGFAEYVRIPPHIARHAALPGRRGGAEPRRCLGHRAGKRRRFRPARGEGVAGRAAFDEAHPEGAFERVEPAGNGGLVHPEPARRGERRALAGEGEQGLEIVPVEVVSVEHQAVPRQWLRWSGVPLCGPAALWARSACP